MDEQYFGAIITNDVGKDDPFLNRPPHPNCVPDPRGLGPFFLDKLREHKHKISQIDLESQTAQTFYEVMIRSIRVAEEMRYRGVTSDDVVSICSINRLDSSLPFFATLFLNAKVASLDPTLSLSDCTYMLNMVRPKFIFVGPEAEQLIESAIKAAGVDTEIVVFGDTDNHVPFSEFLVSTGNEEGFEAIPAENIRDTAIIFFSSGTTGMPKGIMAPHYGLMAQNMYLSLSGSWTRVLYFTTLYWISGVMLLIASIKEGGIRVLATKFHPLVMMKTVQDMKINMISVPPIFTYFITQNPQCCNFDTSSLKNLIVGGGPMREEQMLKLRKLLPHTLVMNTYGMTEASGCVTTFLDIDRDFIMQKPASCGRPLPGVQYRVVDVETGQILGPNQLGEIRIKSDYLMNGYYNNPEESRKAWDEDGFLYTGDVGYYDEDYCFFVEDRIKDLLKYQSWHVVPAELESILLNHPAIKEAVVVGLPDEVDGDLPLAVVVLKPGQTTTEDEIIEYMDDKVSDRKRLRGGVRFIERIPMTPSGKMRRRDIRKMILNNEL